MFQFVPPPEPPALSQNVTPQEKSDRFEIFAQNTFIDRTEYKSGNLQIRQQLSPTPKSSSLIPPSSSQNLQIQRKLLPTNSFSQKEESKITTLTMRDRRGRERKFEIDVSQADPAPAPTPDSERPSTSVELDLENVRVVEVTSDTQEYDEQEQVITARGNVVMRFDRAVMTADSLQVNLTNRFAVAEGNVTLVRGEQVLRGSRFEYFFFEDRGVISNASGEVYQPTANRDFDASSPTDGSPVVLERVLTDRLTAAQPIQNVSPVGGYQFSLGGGPLGTPEGGGRINRVRFEAEKVNFDAQGWQATNVRLTNDPFSPPELEIRADTANYRKVAPLVDELTTTNSRVVFDRKVSAPIFQDRLVFDRRERQPGLFKIGFDGDDRGGLFIEREFVLFSNDVAQLSVTPQYFLQKALFPNFLGNFNEGDEGAGDPFSPSVFGLKSKLSVDIGPQTTLRGKSELTSLDFDEIDEQLRGSLRLQQNFGNQQNPYRIGLEYSYRDRLFNGSLGFQTVQSNIGLLLTSPNIPIGKTGINLTYQAGIQNINADTDRLDLLDAERENDRINLTRYQGAILLNKSFSLWEGKALKATATEGLRYTPVPVVPYLQLNTSITGVGSLYSNGDSQESLTASIGLQGQLGHFSRSFFDYTGFNVTYSQGITGEQQSPFLFDRNADTQTISFGITQQIYGPFRLGFQTSYNLDTGEEISTDYFLEYSRRTYNLLLRYNPILEIGSLSLRISDFNWLGDSEPFDGSGIRPVNQGVKR